VTSATPLIQLQKAGFSYRNRWLVENVDLSVSKGEIVTLIGPNGSGKSTTARLALGVIKPTTGAASRGRGLRIGYVPQKLTIDWTVPLSVQRFMNLTDRLADGAVRNALARTGIDKLHGAEMQELSGGEFQRVLLARAIARNPDLLVLDEPVQGVDFSGQLALYELIAQFRHETSCGVLLISHDLHLVMAATDQVICLNGHVCCSGTPGSVAVNPEYQALFGSKAASTLAIYQHHHDHTHLPDGRVQLADGSIVDAEEVEHHHPDRHEDHQRHRP